LRSSGTEATAPDFDPLVKACIGASSTAAAEYNTVSSSTTSVINVDTGEGATFERGEPLLIKDATNGYSIRPVQSISTDALTLGFNVATAPGTGVDLGQSHLYKPADTGHQVLSIWNYLGNGGATQAMTGSRVTSMDISAEAGQYLNVSYNCEGIGYYLNPLLVTAGTNDDLDFTDDDGTVAAVIPAKWYKSPHELAAAIQTAMQAVQTNETATCTYSDTTGKYTIACSGSVFSLLWKDGTSGADNTDTHIGTTIGFSDAANDTSATTYTSDNALSFAAPHTPSYDSADPIAGKNLEILIGDADDTACFAASSVSINIATPKATKPSLCAESGVGGSLITSREVTVNVSGFLSQYEAEKFERYRSNTETRFLFNFGTKTGGNWDAGKCGMFYLPTSTISTFDLGDSEGLVAIDFTLRAFVDSSGNGEVYLGFV
jgi:hypothetical protein